MTSNRHFLPATKAGAIALALMTASLLFPLFLAGCGGDGDSVIATVGDREVTATYYELKLGKVAESDLPLGEDGVPMDTATIAGKKAFLGVIINKELMAAKAEQLGFGSSEGVKGLGNAVSEVEGGQLMHADLIEGPSAEVTEQDILDYYARAGEQRRFSFIICNFEADALAAREQLLAGKEWTEVANEFNDGSKGPRGDYTVDVSFGRTADAFEEVIFSLEEGKISEPVLTVYGYWIVRLDKVRNVKAPELDDNYRERIRQTLVGRQINLRRANFIKESRERHEFKMDETALWAIFEGLPEDEPYLDPETNKPVPREDLSPLNIDRKDLDKFFFSFKKDLAEEAEVWTVGDYKNLYDEMNTFQRPKRSQALGGVRNKIVTDMVDRLLLVSEARERGYMVDNRVEAKVKERVEQAMITKLHDEVVIFDQFVSKEELDAFWSEHMTEYQESEKRSGRIVYCTEEAQALAASEASRGGAGWDRIIADYEVNDANKQTGGELAAISTNSTGPVRDALFSLEIGNVSDPVSVENGFVVVKLEKIIPARQKELAEVRELLSERIRRIRKDEALDALLSEWREEFPVVINEKALSDLPSWNELHKVD